MGGAGAGLDLMKLCLRLMRSIASSSCDLDAKSKPVQNMPPTSCEATSVSFMYFFSRWRGMDWSISPVKETPMQGFSGFGTRNAKARVGSPLVV